MKALLPLVLLAPAGLSQGHVIVVDAAGGGAYLQIGAALQHASAGDVVLVKSGSYAGFAVANQSLTIAGDANALVQVNGTVQVRSLAAGRRVLLHRLQAFGATSASQNDGPGITIKNDTGPVRVQDCLAQGAAGMPGVRVEGAAEVGLSSSQAIGGVGWEFSGPGIVAEGDAIAVYACDAIGADGAPPWSYTPPGCRGGTAGSGIKSWTNGFIFCGGTLLRGGSGQDGMNGCFGGSYYGDMAHGGSAGDGFDLRYGTQTLWQLDEAFQIGTPGAGGYGQCGCGFTANCYGDNGSPGVQVDSGWWGGDSVVNLSGSSPTLSTSANPARELTTLGITVDSGPGEAVLLVACSATAFAPEVNRGVRLVDWNGPHVTQRIGTTDAQGHLSYSWPIPDLGPGVESQVLQVQALVVSPSGTRRWSNPVSLVLLDGAF